MKYLRTSLLTLGLLVLGHAGIVHAAGSDLFVEEGPVADETAETRNAALSDLLSRVLVRVSGNSGIGGQPATAELLAAAPSLVQQYRYRTADPSNGANGASEPGEVARYLWARFDQASVERMMRERNLPVWSQRPEVLMWIGTEAGGQRELLNLENVPAARTQALAQADKRGMPLQLPLLDLEDQSNLTPADVWSDYQPAIRAASARYPHDMILTGRLSALGGGKWRGVWSLLSRDDSPAFQSPAMGLGETLAFAIDQTQNLLAARYAPMPGAGGSSGTLVQFNGVYDLPSYGRLLAFLEGLEPVSRVSLRYVRDDTLVFDLQLRGDEQNLLRAMDASGQVRAEPAQPLRMVRQMRDGSTEAPISMAPEVDLYYRLLN